MLILSFGRATLLVSALLLLVVGCSDNRLAEVAGTVTVDGKPVESGDISFFPAEGNGPTAGGKIVGGKYQATKVAVGLTKVKIQVPKVIGQKKLYDTPDSPVRDLLGESLPKKFNDETELRFDVQPGNNKKDWELSTK